VSSSPKKDRKNHNRACRPYRTPHLAKHYWQQYNSNYLNRGNTQRYTKIYKKHTRTALTRTHTQTHTRCHTNSGTNNTPHTHNTQTSWYTALLHAAHTHATRTRTHHAYTSILSASQGCTLSFPTTSCRFTHLREPNERKGAMVSPNLAVDTQKFFYWPTCTYRECTRTSSQTFLPKFDCRFTNIKDLKSFLMKKINWRR